MFAIITPSFLEPIKLWLDTSPCRYRAPFVSAPRRIRHFGAHISHFFVLPFVSSPFGFLYFELADDNICFIGCPWPYLYSARLTQRAQANKREKAPGEESYHNSNSITLLVVLLIPYFHFSVVCHTSPTNQSYEPDMLHNFWCVRAK